jgi:hypothetical protein
MSLKLKKQTANFFDQGLRLKSIVFLAVLVYVFIPNAQAEEPKLKVAVVGDTGIGERGYRPGFEAVQRAIAADKPQVLLHLGDFIYQSKLLPSSCDPKYLDLARRAFVTPFSYRLFTPGDNDFPPTIRDPMASGCWSELDKLDSSFDSLSSEGEARPGSFEGTKRIGPVLFVILNSQEENDPTRWLRPRIERAKSDGLWVVIAIHEPSLTSGWFIDKRQESLRWINSLKPDLVLSGNQHSYERFHALGIPDTDGDLPFKKSIDSKYKKGDGSVHVVSGGGGATLKPFADWRKIKERSAPEWAMRALAFRALTHHFVSLEISPNSIVGKTFQVCADSKRGEGDPRWRPKDPWWRTIRLPCEDSQPGVKEIDRFEILDEEMNQ